LVTLVFFGREFRNLAKKHAAGTATPAETTVS
jgi:hypothetical protein